MNLALNLWKQDSHKRLFLLTKEYKEKSLIFTIIDTTNKIPVLYESELNFDYFKENIKIWIDEEEKNESTKITEVFSIIKYLLSMPNASQPLI